MKSNLKRLLGFGVAAVIVGGLPGIGIIFTAVAIESAAARKYKKRKRG